MLHIIWNNNAGSAAAQAALRDELSQRDDVKMYFPDSAEDARQMAAEAAGAPSDTVVAAGGDGSINVVIQGIQAAGANASLGVIPIGTGNDFCRNAGIPLDPRQAVELLSTTRPRPVDLVRAETETQTAHSINMATGGNTGLYADLVTDDMKRFWGPLVYLRGAVNVLTQLQPYRATIGFDHDSAIELDVLNVFVANGRVTGGGLPVAPDAQNDDGLLDVIIVKDCPPIDIAGLAADYVLTDYRTNANIIHRRAISLSVSADPPLTFAIDGETFSDEPIRFSVLPGALRVVAPRSL